MPAALALLGYSFRRMRLLILGVGAIFGAFQVLASLMASTFQQSQAFSQIAASIPGFLRQAFGSSFLTMVSFTGIVVLGYVHFAVTGSLVGLSIAVGTEPASEVERGFSDLLMSRPVARASAITRSVALVIIAATLVNAMMLAGTWIGLALFAGEQAVWPGPRLLLSLAASLWMLMFCFGGVALAFGAGARRRGVAGAGAGLLALALFLLDVVARVRQSARGLGRLSPFHYFNPMDLVAGRPLEASHLAVLGAIGLCGIAAAYIVYARRDL
jgi:ABC-2 type transport system permease protein